MIELEAREMLCAVPAEQVLPALKETALEFGGRAFPRKGGGWRVAAGDWLSTNPNTAPWSLCASLKERTLRLSVEPSFFPWTRAKAARIGAVRLRQFAALLEGKLGPAPRRTLAPHEAAPFAVGATPAEACLAFSGAVASAASSMALVFAVVWLASLQIVEGLRSELFDRAMVLNRIGAPALPSLAELSGFGIGARLGAAALFAMPIAFFLGLVHALVHGLGEMWRPVSRLAPWAAIFLFLLAAISFVPALPFWSAIPCALLVPLAAQTGTTLVWGRRRETLRAADGARPRPLARVAAALLVVGTAYLLTPAPRSHDEMLDSLALFRDRYLLTSDAGRALARAYYRWTPYAAEPLKEIYVPDTEPDAYQRAVRTALVIGDRPDVVDSLRRRGFAVESVKADDPQLASLIRQGGHDICVGAGGLSPANRTLSPEEALLGKDLHAVSRRLFKNRGMQELAGMGLLAIHYLGALFFFALAIGILCVPVGWLYRRASPRAANLAVLAALLAAVVGLALAYRGAPVRELAALRDAAPGKLAEALASPHADVRHEAAYRLYRALDGGKVPVAGLAAPLAAAVADPDLRVRIWACGAAGLAGDPSVRPALLAALEDPEIFVRYRAAEGLGWLDARSRRGPRPADATTTAALQKMARTGAWYEAIFAVNALRRIAP